MENRRAYIRKSFQMYLTLKNQLCAWEQELKELPIPGASGLDYSKENVSNGCGNSVEAQFAQYADKCTELKEKIAEAQKQVEIVKRTIEHFKVESKAKGKHQYAWICERWLKRRSFKRAVVELGIAESTAVFWTEEVYTVAEAIADINELF